MIGGASGLKDAKWATHSSRFGWDVDGIYPSGTDGTHVNGVDMSASEEMIITADDWGLVNIYRNPARDGAKCISLRGHSEHVVRAKFEKRDKYIVSVGGQDKSVMIWKAE